MGLIQSLLSLGVIIFRFYIIIRTGILLYRAYNLDNLDNIEIPNELILFICYMIFEMYIFKTFENNEQINLDSEK